MHIATAIRKTTLRLLELPVKFQLQSTLANPYSFALPVLAFMFGVSDRVTFVICIAFAWVHVWCVLLDLFSIAAFTKSHGYHDDSYPAQLLGCTEGLQKTPKKHDIAPTPNLKPKSPTSHIPPAINPKP